MQELGPAKDGSFGAECMHPGEQAVQPPEPTASGLRDQVQYYHLPFSPHDSGDHSSGTQWHLSRTSLRVNR